MNPSYYNRVEALTNNTKPVFKSILGDLVNNIKEDQERDLVYNIKKDQESRQQIKIRD